MNNVIKILIASSCAIAFVGNAAVIKRGGSGDETASASREIHLINDAALNTNNKFDADFYKTGQYQYIDFNPGPDEVYAMADECIYFADIQTIEQNRAHGELPCYWEFEQGETLDVWGFQYMFLSGLPQYEVNWTITNGVQSWLFSSPDTLIDDVGQLFLNSVMPADMLIGEYAVTVEVKQFAPDGFFFYDTGSHDSIREECGPDPTETFAICWINGGKTGSTVRDENGQVVSLPDGSLLVSTSAAQRLVIKAAQAVPAPVSWSLLLLGSLLAICFSRQQR